MQRPSGHFAYHYAAGAAEDAPPLRIHRSPGAVPLYYCDDGWCFAWGYDRQAVLAAVRAEPYQLCEMAPGGYVEVTALGAETRMRAENSRTACQRVLALVTDGYGAHGGIARYNRDFFDALKTADGIELITVLPRSGVPEQVEIQRLRQSAPTFNKWLYSLRACLLALRTRPTMIFCGHLYMAPLAALLARMLRVPYWLQVHGVEVFAVPGFLIRWAVRRATLVTAVSRYTRSRLLEWGGIDPERVRVLPNTVDERYRPGDREVLKRQASYADRKLLLTVSRLDSRERYKGHEQVFAVLPALLKRHPDLLYLIAGDGSDRARLEARADAAGLSNNVHFLGRVDDDDLLRLYQMSDVFVMPSTGEGFGIVFLEAAACGCAVIGGNADGSVDALAEGAIGAAVTPTDSMALEAAMNNALSQPAPDVARVLRFERRRFVRHVQQLLQYSR